MTSIDRPGIWHSVRGRLLLFNVLVVVSTLVAGGIALLGFSNSSAQLNQLQQQTLVEMNMGRELGMRVAQMAAESVRLVQVVGSIEYQSTVAELNGHISKLRDAVADVSRATLAAHNPTLVERLQTRSHQFEESVLALLDLAHRRHMARSELLGLAHQGLLELDRLTQLQQSHHQVMMDAVTVQVLHDQLTIATGIPAPFEVVEQISRRLPVGAGSADDVVMAKGDQLNTTLGRMRGVATGIQEIETGIRYHNYRIKALVQWLVEDVREYAERSTELSTTRIHALQQDLREDTLRIVVLTILALLVTAIAGRYIYNNLGPHLFAIATAMRRLAGGEDDVHVPALSRRDEIGDLARAFDVFHHNARELRNTLALLAEKSSQLERTFEAMRDGFALFDARGQLRAVNRQFAALLGLDGASVAPGLTYDTFAERFRGLPLNSSHGVLTQLPHHFSETPTSVDVSLPDGREVELRTSLLPTGGAVCVVLDRTRRKTLEAAFHHDQKLKALGQLTGGIAHDFNNLLAVVLGNLELARGAPDSERNGRRLQLAQQAADRAAQLTSRLLAFSRKQALRPTAVPLGRLLDGMWDLLCHAVPPQIQLIREVAPDAWPAYIDVNPLENALLNLVTNARDAIGERAGHIVIRVYNDQITRTSGRRQAMVVLDVADDGCGMDDATRSRIFDPFFTTKAPGAGSGLGLSVVYGFIRQSGGRVKVDSQPGQGTTLHLQLPRAEQAVVAPEVITTPVPALVASQLVLVLEDNDAVRQTLCDQLHALGYLTVDTGDAVEATHLLAQCPEISLFISDVQLKDGADGVTVVQAAQQGYPALRTLLISGHDAQQWRDVARLPCPILRKPFRQQELAAALAALAA